MTINCHIQYPLVLNASLTPPVKNKPDWFSQNQKPVEQFHHDHSVLEAQKMAMAVRAQRGIPAISNIMVIKLRTPNQQFLIARNGCSAPDSEGRFRHFRHKRPNRQENTLEERIFHLVTEHQFQQTGTLRAFSSTEIQAFEKQNLTHAHSEDQILKAFHDRGWLDDLGQLKDPTFPSIDVIYSDRKSCHECSDSEWRTLVNSIAAHNPDLKYAYSFEPGEGSSGKLKETYENAATSWNTSFKQSQKPGDNEVFPSKVYHRWVESMEEVQGKPSFQVLDFPEMGAAYASGAGGEESSVDEPLGLENHHFDSFLGAGGAAGSGLI